MKTKVFLGKTKEEATKGKVPKVNDMDKEGSDAEEASETPAEEAKEEKDEAEGKTPDDGDGASDSGGAGKAAINKDDLKGAIKEVNMEKDLEYSVNHRSKEELQCLIKMAQAKIDAGDFKDSSTASPQGLR